MKLFYGYRRWKITQRNLRYQGKTRYEPYHRQVRPASPAGTVNWSVSATTQHATRTLTKRQRTVIVRSHVVDLYRMTVCSTRLAGSRPWLPLSCRSCLLCQTPRRRSRSRSLRTRAWHAAKASTFVEFGSINTFSRTIESDEQCRADELFSIDLPVLNKSPKAEFCLSDGYQVTGWKRCRIEHGIQWSPSWPTGSRPIWLRVVELYTWCLILGQAMKQTDLWLIVNWTATQGF